MPGRRAVLTLILAAAALAAAAEDASTTTTTPPAGATQAPAANAAANAGDQAADGAPQQPTVEEWPNQRFRWLSQQREKLSSAIFDLIDDVALVDLQIGHTGGRVGLNAGRRVYDNHDVLGSWTVVDHLRVEGRYPLYAPRKAVGNFTIGFTVGGRAGASFLDIRQVMPGHYEEVPSHEQRLREIERSQFYKLMLGEQPARKPAENGDDAGEVDEDSTTDTWILYDDARGKTNAELISTDGLTKARYSRLWNALVFPYRIPLRAEWVRRMQPDEIISYTGYGSVEVGPSVGWNFDVTGITDTLAADVSLTTFVRGDWRISIWREDERYVQVKLTRIASAGRSLGLDAQTDELISGIAVLNWTVNVAQSRVVPFEFSVSRSHSNAFDSVYRYDLESPDARRAFERAVRGRFALSDRLAGGRRWRQTPADAPVRKIAVRETASDSVDKESSARFMFFYRHRHQARVTDSDVVITTPDGVTRFFQSIADDYQLWRWVWGTYEEMQHDFRITVDLDRWEQGLPDALTLTVIGEITDTDTTGIEMRRYMDELEEATGQIGFFPRPPTHFPSRDPPHFRRSAEFDRRSDQPPDTRAQIEYGRSSFYYEVTYDERQVERFIATPPTAMWPALERAFRVPPGAWETVGARVAWRLEHLMERVLNVPLYAINMHLRNGSILSAADDVVRRWRDVPASDDVRERVRRLALVFANRRYGGELSRLLRVVLAGEQVSYHMSGSSSFGSWHAAGTAAIPLEPMPERLQRMIDFDRQRRRAVGDPNASIGDLKVTMPDAKHVRITFGIGGAAVPKSLYFRLDHRAPWRLPQVVREAVYINKQGVFQPGTNELLIDLSEGFMSDLFAGMTPGDSYELRVATSRDGLHWGGVSRARFEVPPPPGQPPKPRPEAPPPRLPAIDPMPSRDPGNRLEPSIELPSAP